jgi:hypothetical protein
VFIQTMETKVLQELFQNSRAEKEEVIAECVFAALTHSRHFKDCTRAVSHRITLYRLHEAGTKSEPDSFVSAMVLSIVTFYMRYQDEVIDSGVTSSTI